MHAMPVDGTKTHLQERPMKTRPATTATGVRPGATSTRVACLTPAGPQPSRTKRVQKGNTRHDFELYYMTLAYPHAMPNGTTPTYPHQLFNEDQADYHHYMTQGYGKGARTKRGQGSAATVHRHAPPEPDRAWDAWLLLACGEHMAARGEDGTNRLAAWGAGIARSSGKSPAKKYYTTKIGDAGTSTTTTRPAAGEHHLTNHHLPLGYPPGTSWILSSSSPHRPSGQQSRGRRISSNQRYSRPHKPNTPMGVRAASPTNNSPPTATSRPTLPASKGVAMGYARTAIRSTLCPRT